ncbi:pyridoxamine 5'-phosphate oxidase domain-containing protein [Trichoderma sp. SZMC 28014]
MNSSTTSARRTRQLLSHLSYHTMANREAPWRSAFLSHIHQMDSPTFTLSTLHPLDGNQFEPRARTVIFRGMWASLPENHRNPAPRNPAVYTSDLPAITTDVRMEKVPELIGSRHESSSAPPEPQSIVGGPVEAVFWAKSSSTQWRLRGQAYVIGPDIESEAAAPVREALQPWMRATGGADEQKDAWSWGRELTSWFGNLSPLMRGSFRNPPPGTPLTQEPEPGLGLGQEVEDVNDALARRNFRVLVIVPENIDQVDLSDPKRARRWNHRAEVSESEISWRTTELWP